MNTIELFLHSYSDSPALEILFDTNKISGTGSIYSPVLIIPLQLRLSQLNDRNKTKTIDFTLMQISGYLTLLNNNRIGLIPPEIIMRNSYKGVNTYPHTLYILLDLKKIELIEKMRLGSDLTLKINVEGLGLINDQSNIQFEKLSSRNTVFEFKIPQSQWSNNVLNRWNYSNIHLVEIEKGSIEGNKVSGEIIEHLKKAEKHFTDLNTRETLASLYSAFETLAIQKNMQNPDKNFFTKILEEMSNDKKDKYRDLFHHYCNLLHLGRHVAAEPNVTLDHRDARLALILGQAILSYISKL